MINPAAANRCCEESKFVGRDTFRNSTVRSITVASHTVSSCSPAAGATILDVDRDGKPTYLPAAAWAKRLVGTFRKEF